MNETGFNWKPVDIKTTAFDGTHRTGNTSIHVPKSYIKNLKRPTQPGELLDMMEKTGHKGPIKTRVVSSDQFEKLAQQNAERDGGRPMVEKTIFIVKPIYVPVQVLSTSTKAESAANAKKRLKMKKQ